MASTTPTPDSPMDGPALSVPSRPTLTLDYALYQSFLDDSGLSEAEKKEFIETLWSIMVSLIDLGFGIEPHSHVCEQVADKTALDLGDLLSLTAEEPQRTATEMIPCAPSRIALETGKES